MNTKEDDFTTNIELKDFTFIDTYMDETEEIKIKKEKQVEIKKEKEYTQENIEKYTKELINILIKNVIPNFVKEIPISAPNIIKTILEFNAFDKNHFIADEIIISIRKSLTVNKFIKKNKIYDEKMYSYWLSNSLTMILILEEIYSNNKSQIKLEEREEIDYERIKDLKKNSTVLKKKESIMSTFKKNQKIEEPKREVRSSLSFFNFGKIEILNTQKKFSLDLVDIVYDIYGLMMKDFQGIFYFLKKMKLKN
jgi:hypothetical protein